MIRYTNIFIFLLISSYSFAIAGEPFDPPVSAHAAALGYAGSTVQANGFASYWNPALLGHMRRWNLSLTQAKVRGDTQLYYGAFSLPISKGVGTAISWSNTVLSDQDKKRILLNQAGNIIVNPLTGKPEEEIVGFFDETDNIVGLSLGLGTGAFSFGGSFKIILNLFENDRAFGLAGDAGLLFKFKRLNLGLRAKNVGNTLVKWNNQDDEIWKASYRGDVGFLVYRGKSLGMKSMILVFLGGAYDEDNRRFDAGLEYGLMDLLFFRLGANGPYLTTGLGFRFQRFLIDYAFTQSDEFFSHHRITFEMRAAK